MKTTFRCCFVRTILWNYFLRTIFWWSLCWIFSFSINLETCGVCLKSTTSWQSIKEKASTATLQIRSVVCAEEEELAWFRMRNGNSTCASAISENLFRDQWIFVWNNWLKIERNELFLEILGKVYDFTTHPTTAGSSQYSVAGLKCKSDRQESGTPVDPTHK